MKGTLFCIVLLFVISTSAGFAAEPVPLDGFIKITSTLLDKFDLLDQTARRGNFNQFNNSELQEKFDDIRTLLKEYEHYSSDTVNAWPDGEQKEIASALFEINFLYRAYSMSQDNQFRHKAEEGLKKVREDFRQYVIHAVPGRR
ncbi:MAG: hypothetical protein C4538_11835 [Nitrospiraceae bacterium]|nr:MAG: hypothetical protein C4538_11835 [Nitrospiraceae bacterium]